MRKRIPASELARIRDEGRLVFACVKSPGVDAMRFLCPSCCTYHQHGLTVPFVPTHRAAHCRAGSPLHELGYYVYWNGQESED